jgi:hypothetical protein
MDCSRRVWMTCSINRIPHQSWHLRIVFVIGDVGLSFSYIYIYMSNYNIYMPIPLFPVHQERPE